MKKVFNCEGEPPSEPESSLPKRAGLGRGEGGMGRPFAASDYISHAQVGEREGEGEGGRERERSVELTASRRERERGGGDIFFVCVHIAQALMVSVLKVYSEGVTRSKFIFLTKPFSVSVSVFCPLFECFLSNYFSSQSMQIRGICQSQHQHLKPLEFCREG